MWKLKSCPRCEGDIFLDRDEHKWYEQCLQCGYLRDLEDMAEVPATKYLRSEEKTV